MSAEFNEFVIAIDKIAAEVDDKATFSIAERRMMAIILDGVKEKNRSVLRGVDGSDLSRRRRP